MLSQFFLGGVKAKINFSSIFKQLSAWNPDSDDSDDAHVRAHDDALADLDCDDGDVTNKRVGY